MSPRKVLYVLNIRTISWLGPSAVLFLQLSVLASKSLKRTSMPTYISLPFFSQTARNLCSAVSILLLKPLWWHGLLLANPSDMLSGKESFLACLHLLPPPFSPSPLWNPLQCDCPPPTILTAFTMLDSDSRQTRPWPLLLPHPFPPPPMAFKTADLPPREILFPWFWASCVFQALLWPLW